MKIALCLIVLAAWGQGAAAQCVAGSNGITEACFAEPAPAGYYGHNILGDTPEWTELRLRDGKGKMAKITLELNIFEDIAPRLADMDGDGIDDVIVVETNPSRGGRLAVYQILPKIGLLAATPYFGIPYRWYAPVGMGDFNGDGVMDVAFVDRPHLAQILRVLSLKNGEFDEIANMTRVTNHRIGDNFITSGVRDCGTGLEMLMVAPHWKTLLSVQFKEGKLQRRKIGAYTGPTSLDAALTCAS